MLGFWNRLELFVVGMLGLAALLISSYQMVTRYLWPAMSVGWAEEVVVYLIVWATFIGSSMLAYRGAHVRADIVIRLFPAPLRRAVEIVVNLICLTLSVLFAYYGYLITIDSYEIGEKAATALAFPLWGYYLALPVGMTLMTLRFAGRTFVLLTGGSPAGSDPHAVQVEARS